MLLSVGLMTQTVFAANTISTTAPTTISLANNAATGTGAYSPLSADIAFSSGAANDMIIGSVVSITAPTGWSFNPAAVVAVTYGTGTAGPANATVSATTISTTLTAASTGAGVAVTFDTNAPLLIRPDTAASASGNLLGQTTLGVALAPTNAGTITAYFASSSSTAGTKIVLSVTIGDPSNIRADGTTSITIQAAVFNDADNDNILDAGECTAAHQGVIVQWTTSRGTLSSSSSTTTATSSQTNASCLATIPLRGNGTTGTANVTAVITQPVPAVATANFQIVAGTITPTQIKFRDMTNSGNVAANQDTVYVTTNNVTQVRFQVTNGADQGSNGQVIQGSVDKGNIVAWTDTDADNIIDNGEVPTSCPDNVTTTFTTKRNTIDGTDVEGIAVFFVCAKAGQAAGPIKVTAKNLTTTMSDATATVTSAGPPNKITAVVTGNTIQVTVTDKDGNNVAENTPVTFQVPSFTGTVAPACALTTGGKASASAAFSGTGGQVLITAFYNSSGAPASCPNGGNTVGASTAVNVGAGGTPPPAQGTCSIVGQVPARGSIALLVTGGSCTAAQLVAAAASAGCTVESLAILEGGVWKIYINGAPAVVNAAFPATLAATTAFFIRCAA
jgi:hypothetical protein